MVTPSGSLLPGRDALMRAAASVGERCAAAAAASRAAGAGGTAISNGVSLSGVMTRLSQPYNSRNMAGCANLRKSLGF